MQFINCVPPNFRPFDRSNISTCFLAKRQNGCITHRGFLFPSTTANARRLGNRPQTVGIIPMVPCHVRQSGAGGGCGTGPIGGGIPAHSLPAPVCASRPENTAVRVSHPAHDGHRGTHSQLLAGLQIWHRNFRPWVVHHEVREPYCSASSLSSQAVRQQSRQKHGPCLAVTYCLLDKCDLTYSFFLHGYITVGVLV